MNYFNYFTEIEDTFIRRRAKHLFLSPLDWAMIDAWRERGIPLHVVIRSIESVFDVFDKNPGPRTIKGLIFCREEIEAQYVEWLASQVGKPEETISETEQFSTYVVAAHIEKSIAALKNVSLESLQEDIARAVSRLEELLADLSDDFETVDKTLGDIEKLLERAMLKNWESAHLKKLEKEVSKPLREYKADMDQEAYKNTFELMLLKRLREEAGVPRLGLFYL